MRLGNKGLRGAVVIATVLMVGATSAAARTTAASSPKKGGTLTFLVQAEVSSLDPATQALVGAGNIVQMMAIYDALLIQRPATGEVEGRLAESLRTTDGGTTWVLKLRPDLVFSDGTLLDAEAVRFNWARIADPATRAPNAANAQRMTSMTVVDPVTLRFTLGTPDTSFQYTVARSLALIGSPTAIKAKGAAFGNSPVGAGPYVVKEWVRNSQLTLDRNPQYSGRTYVDQLVVRVVTDETQRLNTLRSGAADMIQAYEIATYTEAEAAGLTRYSGRTPGGRAIIFNMARAPFDDVRARRGVALALDSTKLNRSLFGGQAEPANSLFVKGSPYYDESTEQPKANRKQAQKLFDQLAAAGKPLDFSILVIPLFQQHAEWLLTELRSYQNVTVKLEPIQQNQLIAALVGGNYQSTVNAYNFIDPSQLGEFFHSEDGARHYSHWNNPEVDALLDKGTSTNSQSVRVSTYLKLQELMLSDVPHKFYVRNTSAVIFDPSRTRISGGEKAVFGASTMVLLDRIWKMST